LSSNIDIQILIDRRIKADSKTINPQNCKTKDYCERGFEDVG
jgi:hypothetical protein